MDKYETDIHDVAVIGAGLVGMVVARCFSNTGLRVLLLDKPPTSATAIGHYPLTLRHSSRKFLESLGFNLSGIETSLVKTLNLSSRGYFGSVKIQEPNFQTMAMVMPINDVIECIQQQINEDARIDCVKVTITDIEAGPDELLTLKSVHGNWDVKRCVLADGANSNLSRSFPRSGESYAQPMQSIILPIKARHWQQGAALIRQDRQTVFGVVPGPQKDSGWIIATTAYHETLNQHAWKDQYNDDILNASLSTRLGEITITDTPVRRISMLQKQSIIAQDGIIRMGNTALSTPPIGAQGLNLALQDCCELFQLQKRYAWQENKAINWQKQLVASCQRRHDFWFQNMKHALDRLNSHGNISNLINGMAWAFVGSNHTIQSQITRVGQGVF